MSKKGKRLREFEKNNRVFNIEEARKKREEKYKDRRSEKAAQAAYLQDMGQDRGDGTETDAATEAGTGIDLSQKTKTQKDSQCKAAGHLCGHRAVCRIHRLFCRPAHTAEK